MSVGQCECDCGISQCVSVLVRAIVTLNVLMGQCECQHDYLYE